MRRKVRGADFRDARGAVFGARGRGGWAVFDKYQIRDGEIRADPHLVWRFQQGFLSDYDEEGFLIDDAGFGYCDPLDDIPSLFLKFAKLHEEADFESAALRFAHDYGLPDGEDTQPNPDGIGIEVEPYRLSLPRFREEARRAWVILALYEAVLNGHAKRIGSLFLEHGEGEPFEDWAAISSWVPPRDPFHRNYALGCGLRCAAEATDRVVQRLCRQVTAISLHPEAQPKPSSCTGAYWTYDNLLGAMYLQMQWLLLSGAVLVRCEACGDPVPIHPPRPGERKTPKHKRHCGEACYQAAYREKKKNEEEERKKKP